MPIPLLTTKLYTPPLRPELVSRPHLIERLDAGLHRRPGVTLVSAPAGFGKTTLLCEWIAERRSHIRVAWLSLDAGDNDPARFLAYLVAALHQAGVDQDVTGGLGPEEFLTTLINQIGATPGDIILILDDYHLITAQPVHDILAFLIDHLPGNMHLVIATRADPPLPIARLRGRGQLVELRQTDLRFTPEEATEFLRQVMGLVLSAGDIAALTSRTEGWIAGLQMAAVSMQGRSDSTGFVEAFAGSHRHILDYLVEEVLQRQPGHVQDFLLQTAILERMCGPLCDTVCLGRAETPLEEGLERPPDTPRPTPHAQQTLEYLDRANLFVVPLDEHREWYRYHRLFVDLLRQRLYQVHPDLVPTLHRRASEWYEQHDLVGEAIEHALAARDFQRAAHLIDQVAETTLMRSEMATLLRWVDALPDDLVRARPFLCVAHAWVLFLSGRSLDAIESRLQDAARDADPASARAVPLRAWLEIFQGRITRATELARLAVEQLPEDDLFLRSVATWTLSISQLVDGDLAAGRQALGQVIRMGQETGNVMIAVLALCNLAQLRIRRGQLGEAQTLYERALTLATDEQGHLLPIAGEALMGLGNLWREWNDLEVAARHLVKGIDLIKRWGETSAVDGYAYLARVRQAQGDTAGAQEAIREAQQLALRSDFTQLDDLFVDLLQARLWIAQGDVEAAAGWAEGRGLVPLPGPEGDATAGVDVDRFPLREDEAFVRQHLRKYEHLVLARLLLTQGRPEETLTLLAPLLPRMEQRERVDLLIEIRVLEALAYQAQGDVEGALGALERALSLAEPGGHVRVFLDEGEPLARLLYQAAARGVAPTYVDKLLAAFSNAELAASRDTPRPPGRLIESLSERELEVLQLVAAGYSNREIARQIFVSPSTVKVHTRNIYRKLDVHSRTHAVAKARALGILPAT